MVESTSAISSSTNNYIDPNHYFFINFCSAVKNKGSWTLKKIKRISPFFYLYHLVLRTTTDVIFFLKQGFIIVHGRKTVSEKKALSRTCHTSRLHLLICMSSRSEEIGERIDRQQDGKHFRISIPIPFTESRIGFCKISHENPDFLSVTDASADNRIPKR